MLDVTTDEGLKAAVEEVRSNQAYAEKRLAWARELAEDIEFVRDADIEQRSTYEFHHRLWEENKVSAVGRGTVQVEAALKDEGFRRWLAARSMEPLAEPPNARVEAIRKVYEELIERLESFGVSPKPHLKIYRVLALLYPGQLTTLSARHIVRKVFSALGGKRAPYPIARHGFILDRLRSAIGEPSADDALEIAEWIGLPWHLWVLVLAPREDDATVEPTPDPGDEKLKPLPAARRRRGITALKGGFSMLLGTLEFLRDDASRDELIDYLRSENPDYKESSIRTAISALQAELAVIRSKDGRYELTERGGEVLETGESEPLSDWLLTHILGIDAGLVALRDEGELSHNDWISRIQAMNPGWTTTRAPASLSFWMRSLKLVELDEGSVKLTDDGRSWASRIHWTPEPLESDEPGEVAVRPKDSPAEQPVQLPALDSIVEQVRKHGYFEKAAVAQLHAGLWAHERRHFAILTGLSGTGKTLLAQKYAESLSLEPAPENDNLLVVAVAPGWYDPGALLGYVNPLRGDSYISTPFLQFVLRAERYPTQPHVAILDEMNLSHPEQYLAPLLSAMETGEPISLHTEGDTFDGVPSSLRYPSNLAIIGTVNMDETTHGLSDKVLDRAFTMEFWDVDLSLYPRWEENGLGSEALGNVREALTQLAEGLAPARLHFGWRVIDDVLDFVALSTRDGGGLALADALDRAVYAKVLPKLRGDDSPRFRESLQRTQQVLKDQDLPLCLAKVEELRLDLDATGSARFWR